LNLLRSWVKRDGRWVNPDQYINGHFILETLGQNEGLISGMICDNLDAGESDVVEDPEDDLDE